ncbi:MAG: serine protease, partial [Gaiellaceae bacterium]|nr:serine protease [Gaiellaceae bacterium]
MIRATTVAAAAVLVFAGQAGAARFAVGVDPSVSLQLVAAQLPGRVSFRLAALHTLVVDAPSVRGAKRVHGVRWVEWLGSHRRRVAFTPTDPLAPKQWYLQQDHAFDAWADVPPLAPVPVAIIDSGIDLTHPDLAPKITLARSFVGGSANDQAGHGTFVAGEIAATLDNNEGIAGIAFPAQLIVAKVVRPDLSISLEAEAEAIRWAADQGARVINLSLGGLRDPRNPDRDTYSPLEAAAVDYAASRGAVLVAAVGNGDQAPQTPWPFASYPAALPHVIGVSALAHDGSVPAFSDRDAIYNDLAAPGQDIYSTLPRALTRQNPTCPNQGYSDCGPDDYKHAEGTSFAAPQVAAGAALLIAQDPALTASQVSTLLERTADDVNASNGCPRCPLLRDSFTGWGRLNIAKALAVLAKGSPPPADAYETNDDAGPQAKRIYGTPRQLKATIDYWDDPIDVYAVALKPGKRLTATLTGPPGTNVELFLWSPQTQTVTTYPQAGIPVAKSTKSGALQALAYRAPRGHGGVYYLEAKITAPGT